MTGLVVLEKMGMLVLLMAVGFAAAKANWVGDGFNQATSRLVANVFLPASILSSVIGVAPLFSGKELAVVIAGTFVLFGWWSRSWCPCRSRISWWRGCPSSS